MCSCDFFWLQILVSEQIFFSGEIYEQEMLTLLWATWDLKSRWPRGWDPTVIKSKRHPDVHLFSWLCRKNNWDNFFPVCRIERDKVEESEREIGMYRYSSAGLFTKLSSVQHKRAFCCIRGMIPWPRCGLGNYKRAYFTIPISVSVNDCTLESASVSASMSECVWMCEPSASTIPRMQVTLATNPIYRELDSLFKHLVPMINKSNLHF